MLQPEIFMVGATRLGFMHQVAAPRCPAPYQFSKKTDSANL